MRYGFLAILAALFFHVGLKTADAGTLVARVDISSQTMTVSQNGFVKYRWKVSTARNGYVTPLGQFKARWASRNHRSRKYNNTPMPYAIFYHYGYAIHATYDLKRLGRPASHGCIRLHPDNAATFFRLANQVGLNNTKITVSR